jgi:hypothetical protein
LTPALYRYDDAALKDYLEIRGMFEVVSAEISAALSVREKFARLLPDHADALYVS